MNETTLNLIQAIANGDALETEQAFATAMAEKLSVKLDDMRVEVAQGMFNQTEPVTEEIIELTPEEYESLSEEEKQAFTLDEGIGKFVGKVAKGTANAVGNVAKGTANAVGNVVGGIAKTAGALRQAPSAIGNAYNRGRAAAQKSIDK
jgi:hypothetical protein